MSLSCEVKKLVQVESYIDKVRLLDRNQEGSNKMMKKNLSVQIGCMYARVTHFS